jgi:hypothetical protein
MSDDKCANMKLVYVRWIIYGVILVAGFYGWIRTELSVKADLKTVEQVCARQEKQDDVLQDIRQRLIRIETKLEK